MQFCKPHWDRMRAEIEVNGLSHMVLSKDVMFKQIVDAAEMRADDNTAFDPLMAMHNQIVERFCEPLADGGLYLFTGDYCPLCELDKMNPGRNLPENWIVYGTKDLANYLRRENMTDEILDEEVVEKIVEQMDMIEAALSGEEEN